MALFSSKSKDWLEMLETVNRLLKEDPNRTGASLAEELGISSGQASNFTNLSGCLNQAAIDKIRSARPYNFSLNSALALTGLKKAKTGDLATAIHTALDTALSRRLPTLQIKDLVKWMASGKSAESFDPSAKPLKMVEEPTEPESESEETGDPEAENIRDKSKRINTKGVKTETLGQRIGSGIDRIVGLLEDGFSKSPAAKAARGKTRSPKNPKALKTIVHTFKKIGEKFAKIAWKELFKIEHRYCRKLAHAIVSSRASSHSTSSGRSGHSRRSHNSGSFHKGFITLFLTVLHWVVYVLLQYGFLWTVAIILICPFVPWLRPWLEWPFRFAAHLAVYDFPAWVWAGLKSHSVPVLIIVGLLAVGAFYAWKAERLRMSLLGAALAYLVIHGRGWALESAPWNKPAASETQVASVPTAEPQTSVSIASPSPKKTGTSPTANAVGDRSTSARSQQTSYQPAISFQPANEDPKILELEIAALSDNVVVKDHPMTPDEGMPPDVALSRMQDVIDPDKYAMMIGGDKETVQSANATNTALSIYYKSADPLGGFLGGSKSPMTFLWEDVRYIHINEIDHFSKPGAQPDIRYQMTVVVKGSKIPMTLQCASTDDLENLVSTMEYFIRHSRLAHDAQPGGMPYPAQGVRLSNDCVVEKLWADSPMANAGLGLRDMIWSMETNAADQPDHKKLLADLAGLSPGSHAVFVVSPADRDQAQGDVSFGRARNFNPKRRKVILTIL